MNASKWSLLRKMHRNLTPHTRWHWNHHPSSKCTGILPLTHECTEIVTPQVNTPESYPLYMKAPKSSSGNAHTFKTWEFYIILFYIIELFFAKSRGKWYSLSLTKCVLSVVQIFGSVWKCVCEIWNMPLLKKNVCLFLRPPLENVNHARRLFSSPFDHRGSRRRRRYIRAPQLRLRFRLEATPCSLHSIQCVQHGICIRNSIGMTFVFMLSSQFIRMDDRVLLFMTWWTDKLLRK